MGTRTAYRGRLERVAREQHARARRHADPLADALVEELLHGARPVPAQMWQGVSPVPAQMWQGVSPVLAQTWQGGEPSPWYRCDRA